LSVRDAYGDELNTADGPRSEGSPQKQHPPVILVADDEPDMRSLMSFVLIRAGYEVVSASDGDQAVRFLFERKPHLAILDVNMPGRSGYSVTSAIREDGELRSTPVLLVSATTRMPSEEGLQGADSWLSKPFASRDLLDSVASLLGRKTETP